MLKKSHELYMPKDEDYHLINETINGDRIAFNKLVIRYQDMVYTLCFRYLNNKEDALDCAQEIFVSVYNSLKKFKFKSKFSTWLYSITINTCKNKLKSFSRKHEKLTASLDSENNPINKNSVQSSDNPLKNIETKELKKCILNALDKLSHIHKTLIILRYFEDKNYHEISKITGLKSGTIKSKLSRARKNLGEYLEDNF